MPRTRPAPTSRPDGTPPTAAARKPATSRRRGSSPGSRSASRRISYGAGTIPSRRIPKAATIPHTVMRTTLITARPAANLPLITSSRWIGWDSSRGSVPCERSPLIESNMNARPSSGATSPMNDWTVRSSCRIETSWAPAMNSAMNRAGIPLTSDAMLVICSVARKIGMPAASPRIRQQDDEPRRQQVIAELLVGDDHPAGARDRPCALSRLGRALGGRRGAVSGRGRSGHAGTSRGVRRSGAGRAWSFGPETARR